MTIVMSSILLMAGTMSHAEAGLDVYPQVGRLSPQDIVFRQIGDSIAQGHRAESGSGEFPDLFFATWVSRGDEDLFSLAARLNIPYETLATLNGIGRPRQLGVGEVIVIPSVPGVFVADKPRNDLDELLSARLGQTGSAEVRVSASVGHDRLAFTFYPGARLFRTERSFFLEAGFRMPLQKGVMSSRFGMRTSPIDGHDRMHNGVDLAAPAGSDVLAARDGVVSASGTDPSLGKFVMIDHGGGLSTVYGHLSAIRVELNRSVRSGTIIGAVGSTGLSTGPHLHFEIRLGGTARDPSGYLHGLRK